MGTDDDKQPSPKESQRSLFENAPYFSNGRLSIQAFGIFALSLLNVLPELCPVLHPPGRDAQLGGATARPWES